MQRLAHFSCLTTSLYLSLSFFQLEEELSGVVEVIGMVSNKGAIMANSYNLLREDKGIPFGRLSYIAGLYIRINTAAFMCNS